MKIKSLLPIAVFRKLSLVEDDPKPGHCQSEDRFGVNQNLLVPGLFVETLGIDM